MALSDLTRRRFVGLFGGAAATAALPVEAQTSAASPSEPSRIYNMSLSEFKERVTEAKGPVIVDFWASWCKPCVPMKAELEKVARARPDVKFVQLDHSEVTSIYDYVTQRGAKELALTDPFFPAFQYFNSLPELFYYKDGKLAAINDNLRVLGDGEKATYFNNGSLLSLTKEQRAAAPKDAKGNVIEPGKPVNTAEEIMRWMARVDAGTFAPKSQLLPKATVQMTPHDVPLTPAP